MKSSSGIPISNSQQLKSLILQQLANVTHAHIAPLIGLKDATKISKFTAGNIGLTIDELCALLPLINLALVESEGGSTVTIPRWEYKALCAFLRKSLPIDGEYRE